MTKEKTTRLIKSTEVQIEENQIVNFSKSNTLSSSYKVYDNGFCGVYYKEGKCDDSEGYQKAEKNLELKRPYPFELEVGKRSLDKLEQLVSDEEMMNNAKKIVKYLKKKYPDFSFSGEVAKYETADTKQNSKGMDYKYHDGYNNVCFSFKHKDSKDISDGYINLNLRTFKIRKFYEMADLYLENFTKTVEMPKDCYILDLFYGYTGKFKESLNIEKLKTGSSLLSGKVGQQVFSLDLTVMNDVTEKNIWMDTFWDGDGVTVKGDKTTFIKNGKILRGYADKKTGKKYKVQTTGSAYENFADIPSNGKNTMSLKIGKKTAKELLNGKLAIIPIQSSGGGFKEKGEYTMPVQIGLLTDGEKILGRVAPFTISTNMFDMFGKDFVGVAKINKLFNDKCFVFKANAGPL